MVDIQFIQTQTHSSYSHCIMMDCLSQAFSVIVVIEDTQQQPTMISMSKKLPQAVKPYFSGHKLRRLRKKWLTSGKTSNEIKQLSMAYYRDKRAKKQTHVTNNDISSTSRHQRKRKRVSSSTSE